ncbi:MAG: hypothetical protein R3B09_32665 [Nannocystaceae bacterium]
MIHSSLTRHFACLSLIAALIAPACSGDDKGTSATESSTTDAETTSSSASDSSTTASTTDSSGTATDGMTTTTTTTTTDTTATTTTTGVDPQPNGAMCSSDAECQSMSCFVVPLLGGLCGDCKVDSDCDNGGCTIPNPLMGVGAVCNSGEPGAGCMTSDVCSDPTASVCGLVLDASPIIAVKTCSECEVNADCTDPSAPNCSPTISVADFSGQLTCVPDGSVPNDSACNRAEEGGVPIGNSACESGKCTTAVIMTVVQIGVCGECFTDDDCDPGKSCQDAAVDTDTFALIGAKCV